MSAKVIGLSLFAVVSAILSLRSTAQDFTVWQLYNHWAAIIVNGPVFEGWLDIGQMYFVWFCCKTDFLRAPLLKSAHCCIIGMSEFVIQQFKMVVPSAAVAAKQRGDPAAQFFLLCIPARVGSNFTWLIYVVPYVTHICPASFFYLPAGFMFFLVVTLATGLVIAGFIAPVFDTYGDSWRAEAADRNSDSPLSAILVAKQVRTFVGRFVMGGCYAIAATFTYTLLCNWAVLLYENGYYRNSEGYISVVWDELSMRNAPCSLLSFREAIHRGDALRIVEGVISYF
jgi:hypothetical protein